MKTKMNLRQLTTMAMLAAISILLTAVFHVPLFSAAPYLKTDVADVPLLLAAYLVGPGPGLLLTGVVCILHSLLLASDGGLWGMVTHFVASGTLVYFAGLIAHKRKRLPNMVLGLLVGTVLMTLLMCALNLYATPILTGIPQESVREILLSVLLPFHVIKGGVNGLLALLLYPKLKQWGKTPLLA